MFLPPPRPHTLSRRCVTHAISWGGSDRGGRSDLETPMGKIEAYIVSVYCAAMTLTTGTAA